MAVDQGTSSTRAIVYSHDGRERGSAQLEHAQIFPRPGWVEHDAVEILANTRAVMATALTNAGATATNVCAIGIANQTETTVVWDRATGVPVYNAITWQDTRGQDFINALDLVSDEVKAVESEVRVELNAYFSSTKICWLLANIPGLRGRALAGDLAFGSIESWLCWNLSGGPRGGVHVPDVSNASRTLLMDMAELRWSDRALKFFDIPRELLPAIVSTSEVVATVGTDEPLAGVPIAALMGDQQAATFGQVAFSAGEAKCTYGTGNFLIFNTGNTIVQSTTGLIATVVYQRASEAPCYGLEGSVAVTGSLIQWLRDNLQIIASSSEIEALARSVPDSGGVVFVPAFSGLYAPRWRPDARGVVVGIRSTTTAGHIARAALEACAFQTVELITAIDGDWSSPLTSLRVDGGMTSNELLMQFQADLLGVPVIRPVITETTALGVAYSAGLAVRFWSGLDELRAHWRESHRWTPAMKEADRMFALRRWNRAVTASLDWVAADIPDIER